MHFQSGYLFKDSISCLAALIAFKDGPRGFSFDANFTTLDTAYFFLTSSALSPGGYVFVDFGLDI